MSGGAPDVIEARAESCYNMALGMIAMGETRAATKGAALAYDISISRIDHELGQALRDALASGVEREDIDPSWFPHCATTLSCYVDEKGKVVHSVGCQSS